MNGSTLQLDDFNLEEFNFLQWSNYLVDKYLDLHVGYLD